MAKNRLAVLGTLVLVLLFSAGCRKESIRGDCRLVHWQGLDDGYLRTLSYNSDGLLAKWIESAPLYESEQSFTFEYGTNRRITKMGYYDHDALLYTVRPVYHNGRISKEIWYLGDTQAVDDTVENTYNGRGLLTKRESLLYNYYVLFQYDAIGNSTRVDINDIDGTKYQTEYLEFEKPVREPMNAVPGLPYGIPFANYVIDKLKYTYYKAVGYDENGDPVTFYEHDREKSVPLTAGPEGYAVYYNTYDNVTQVYNRQIWEFENCDCDNNSHQSKMATTFGSRPSADKKIRSRFMSVDEMKKLVTGKKKAK